MSRLLVSKKGRAPVFYMCTGTIFIVVGIWMLINRGGAFNLDDAAEFVVNMAPFALLLAGILFGITAWSYSKTYITIYEDRVEGVGTCGKGGLSCQSFHFDSRTKYVITAERSFVCVNVNDIRYYVSLSSLDVSDVKLAVEHKKVIPGSDTPVKPRTSLFRSSPKKTVVCKCTFCGTKCKVPGGKGRFMMTCPECKEEFTAIT